MGQARGAALTLCSTSPVMSPPPAAGLREVSQHMVSRGVASRVVVKEEILPAADLAGEHCHLARSWHSLFGNIKRSL